MSKRLICLTITLLVGGPALANASNGPVGWWKLDDGAGTVAVDAVAGNNGVLTGDGKWVAGQFGGALQFDGTDDYVTLPIGSLISTLGDSTFMSWANFSNAGGAWQRIFDFGSDTGTYMFLCPRNGTSNPLRFAIRTATVGEQIVDGPTTLASGWHHVAVAFDSKTMTIKVYIDGGLIGSVATVLLPKDLGVTTQNWLGKSQWPDALYQGDLDELRIYDRTLTQDDIVNVVGGGLGYGLASNPVAADKATFVLTNQKLSWTAGPEAQTHDVYFGTDREAVLTADSANPKGVAVSKGQSGTTFDPGQLAYSTTYYWRVDEVGPAPDYVIYKGNLWTFTTEPFAYTMAKANIKATASSSAKDTMGPEKTIDGSGLDANGGHSTVETDMWLSSTAGPEPAWIQYEFDQVYSLNEMMVWNYNSAMESILGYGAWKVTVEYSVDGAAWTKLGDDAEFTQALGEEGYAADTIVDFKNVPVKFVKLTINSNWGEMFPQYGLSEVRFLYIPAKATDLKPASGSLNLESPVAMSWRPGRGAVSHQVYLGTDKANLPLVATVTEPKYSATVQADQTYYWKIVEVNEAAAIPAWETAVLSFTSVLLPKDPGTGNLTHQYEFDDGTANDSVGTANGTLIGGAAVVDGALVTSAQDQWMEMPADVIALNAYPEITLAAWYTPKAAGNTGYTMLAYFGDSVGGLGANGYFISPARGDNVTRTAISVGNTSAPWSAESGVNGTEYDDGKLHFVVSTINATNITLYLDGELIATSKLSATNSISGIANKMACLARGGYTGDPEWIGAIHEFRIYNKALSTAEVLYLSNTMPKDPGSKNLKHMYTFEDGTANDSVGQANGTLVGGAAVVDGSLVTSAQDQWVELPGSVIAMNTYKAVSIAAWVTPKAGANTGYSMVTYFGDSLNGFGSNGLFMCASRGDNVSRFGISCGNTSAPWGAESGVNGKEYDDGLPHFFVGTIDATNITLYIDGQFIATNTLSAANKIGGISQNFAYLAKGGYTGDPEWIGSMQEVRIYDKALTSGEVQFLSGDWE